MRPTRAALLVQLRQAEENFERSERRWNFALEGAGHGVWDADLINDTVYYSRMWKLMRGFDPTAIIDGSQEAWFARLHPGDRERIAETLAKQHSGEIKLNVLEYRERHQNGHYIWISSLGAPVEWAADGTPTRMIGTDTDISRQKNSEQQDIGGCQCLWRPCGDSLAKPPLIAN